MVAAVLTAVTAESLVQLTQIYRFSYDAYTHVFFADHYRRDWFNLWDDRWYGGVSVTTYPPLTHQLMALISFLLNLEMAYQVIAILAYGLLSYSIYLFSRIFLTEGEAQYTAFVGSLLPAAGLVLNAFGQLPTVFSTALALIAAYKYSKYLEDGSVKNLVQASLWTSSSGLAHHFTFLFFVPLTQLTVLILFLRRGKFMVKRTLLHLLLTAAVLVLILWPLINSATQALSLKEIPHATRENLFLNFISLAVFFWGVYSFTILLLPNAIAIALRRRDLLPLLALFIVLFLFGLGGTTPLPRLVLGSLWQVLTYDRFAFWAMVTYSPFLGIMLADADIFTRKYFWGDRLNSKKGPVKTLLIMSFFVGLIISFGIVSGSVVILGLQHEDLLSSDQLERLASFLDTNSEWKYITLGLNSQRFLLSAKTSATTLDGGYNHAKTNPLLTESGVESLDAAKHFPNGLSLLKKVLREESNNGLKYVISADRYYDYILRENGLRPLFTLYGPKNVTVWEIPYAMSIKGEPSHKESSNIVVTALWSLGPLTILAASIILGVFDKGLRRWSH
ncbi:MAG: hypothetical protein NZ920_05965 [Aigarchaeota archaeon]|nr:hypothetical protein [Aigarchaeota archaeon]MDW8092652.1 hypothetical protein [Nitrososphaerota archaeon]